MPNKFVWEPGDLHRGDCDVTKNEMDAVTYELLRRPCRCFPPKEENIGMAVALVHLIAGSFNTVPDDWSLIPVSDGSMQAELSQNGWDVEIMVRKVR